ncbi:hypothetical protein T03_8710 [Trichinella britovi]|uniref:Deltamethrin resistance protein prag01 domain-containing protein n=1 Tax=Trichinella britovi TaxID=45882 RepID=A0A0V1DDH3_TRIBR|nr:hypothetical protein T03_8710 [Trichinella britovi]
MFAMLEYFVGMSLCLCGADAWLLRPIERKLRRFLSASSVRHESSGTKMIRLATFDEIPIPHEPYAEGYQRENRTFNRILALGTVMLSVTCGLMYVKGWWGLEPTLPPKAYRNRVIERD